ncbi:hypothetical protein THOM_0237 [Trachipleistophora hominis]|uniref:Uncharacterized protein n=1 Tax=Trachipleistophora hominis TaxID=72359 RepID=L7K079_TRAHO|nr:hypothetical protein THOM_0237 [Trachipleistophora hominis]
MMRTHVSTSCQQLYPRALSTTKMSALQTERPTYKTYNVQGGV